VDIEQAQCIVLSTASLPSTNSISETHHEKCRLQEMDKHSLQKLPLGVRGRKEMPNDESIV